MPHQARQDRADPQDHPESQVQLDPTENQESQPNRSLWCPESQESPETKDQTDPPDHQDPQDKTAHQDQPDRRESQVQTEPQAKMDRPDRQDHQEVLAPKERRVFARSTAPWTAVSSSKTALGVKRAVEVEVGRDSQASQRNAVFLLLFCVPFLFTPSDDASRPL